MQHGGDVSEGQAEDGLAVLRDVSHEEGYGDIEDVEISCSSLGSCAFRTI